jgi:hypothetical protein
MKSEKKIASLSLDLDNRWSYLKTHGDREWEKFPSYLDTLVPRVLAFLAQRNLKITFFIVGQDALLEENHAVLQNIAEAGHEIGNHSFSHEPWLHLEGEGKIEGEITLAAEQINRVTGQYPVGFRGPGFGVSDSTLAVLHRLGYLYDASSLPTYFGPLARLYYFRHAALSADEEQQRASLFGSLRDGLRPLKPYRCGGVNGLLEIPVTTLPIVRSPIHVSYILYLSRFSPTLALAYFRTALALCKVMGISPSLLLHPLDFLGKDDEIGLDFFPAMNLDSGNKLSLVGQLLQIYCETFHIVTLREHALFATAFGGDAAEYCVADSVASVEK